MEIKLGGVVITNNHRSLLNICDRILLHLLNQSHNGLEPEAPEVLTAAGIASAVFTDQYHMPYYLKTLKSQEYTNELVTHIKNKKRKQKVYYLTDIGRGKAIDIKEKIMKKDITILDSEGKAIELKFPEVTAYLKENKICQKLKDLEMCKLISNNGVFNINFISEVKQSYIHFIEDALEPEYFFGRTKELRQLKTWIADKKLYRVIILRGIAGIGKTTLISKLIEDYKGNKHLFWYNVDKWTTVRSVLSHLAEFLSKIDGDNLKSYINFNKPLDPDKLVEILKKKIGNLNALFIFDDFHKANEDIRNLFTSILNALEEADNVKFIILTRYNIPFYDRQKVLVRKSVTELELEGLDFESSAEILHCKDILSSIHNDLINCA